MARIFISYRRAGSAGHAGRLYDRLGDALGDDLVFLDFESLAIGKWMEAISKAASGADATLVVIGSRWLDEILERAGRGELDPVRLEVVAALGADVPLVPILVGGATMPSADTLPPDLAPLAEHNAFEVSDARFDHDFDRLVTTLASDLGIRLADGSLKGPRLSVRAEPWDRFNPDEVKQSVHARGIAELTVASRDEPTGEVIYVISRADHAAAVPNQFRVAEREGRTVVEDYATGLVWLSGPSDSMAFQAAEAYVESLRQRAVGGYADWRLPTLEEAITLVQSNVAAEHGSVFPGAFDVAPETVWTCDRWHRNHVWIVRYADHARCFVVQIDYNDFPTVLAVRSSHPPRRFSRSEILPDSEREGLPGVPMSQMSLPGRWVIRIESPSHPPVRIDLTVRDDESYRGILGLEHPGAEKAHLSGVIAYRFNDPGRLVGIVLMPDDPQTGPTDLPVTERVGDLYVGTGADGRTYTFQRL